jgi:hypothetical protein
MNPGTASTSRPDYRHLSDPELIAERAAVRERLEHLPAVEADLIALATILDAEIAQRGHVLVVNGPLAPAEWR